MTVRASISISARKAQPTTALVLDLSTPGMAQTATLFPSALFPVLTILFDAVGNATIPKSLTSPAVTAGAITVNGTGLTTTSLTASGETSVPTANSGIRVRLSPIPSSCRTPSQVW